MERTRTLPGGASRDTPRRYRTPQGGRVHEGPWQRRQTDGCNQESSRRCRGTSSMILQERRRRSLRSKSRECQSRLSLCQSNHAGFRRGVAQGPEPESPTVDACAVRVNCSAHPEFFSHQPAWIRRSLEYLSVVDAVVARVPVRWNGEGVRMPRLSRASPRYALLVTLSTPARHRRQVYESTR